MANNIKNKLEFKCDESTMNTIFEKYNTFIPKSKHYVGEDIILCEAIDTKN